jgi:hypothetical protein
VRLAVHAVAVSSVVRRYALAASAGHQESVFTSKLTLEITMADANVV